MGFIFTKDKNGEIQCTKAGTRNDIVTIFVSEKWFNKYLKDKCKSCQSCYEDKWRNLSYSYYCYSYNDTTVFVDDYVTNSFTVRKGKFTPKEDYSGYFED